MNKEHTGLSNACFGIVMMSVILMLPVASDAALDIDTITLTVTEYRFGGVPDRDPYEFGGGVTGDDITAVTLTTPGGVVYDLEAWSTNQYHWGFSFDDLTLVQLQKRFPNGDYTFTLNGTVSVTLTHNPTPPTGFANITNPVHNAINVSLNPTFTWDDCSAYGDALTTAVAEEEGDMISVVWLGDISETSWTVGPLKPGLLHWLEVSVYTGTTPSSQSTANSDTFEYYDFFENCSGVYFLTEGPVQATVKIKPETLNLSGKGILTAFIDLPELLDEEDIDISTVKCEGASALKRIVTGDGRLVVKFDRKDLDVSPGDLVELTVTGQLSDGTSFTGSDTIRAIDKSGKK